MRTDSDLLRCYAETRAEEAFAELVRRHINLVYSAAQRQVNGDAHLAEDVAQTVFAELARKASVLAHRPVLTGWLYTCAHHAAVKVVRNERRRHNREQEAQAMHDLLQTPAPGVEWDRLGPVLDDAMHKLRDLDREAILMRYFENRPLADIGHRFGLSEDAARKRVDRALEKLRGILARRGISATAALAAVLSANAVEVAPAGLGAALTTASLAGTTAGTGTTLTLIKLMTLTKLKLGIVSGILIAGVAAPLVIRNEMNLRRENEALRAQAEQAAGLAADNERLSNSVVQANEARKVPNAELGELLRLRGEVGNLRRQTNELAKLQGENQRLRSSLAASGAIKPPAAAATTSEILPRESWGFAGYAEPESAFQSAVWAKSRGDAKGFLAGLVPEGHAFAETQGMTVEEFAKRNKEEFANVTGFKIMEKEIVSADEVILTVFAAGINESGKFKLQRLGADWKLAGPMKDGDAASAK